MPVDFDKTHIALVNFVADKAKMGGNGTVAIETKGLHYIETVDNDPLLNATHISHLSGVQQLGSFASTTPVATATLAQTSQTQFSVTYNVANADSYAGSFSLFDNPATVQKEVRDFSSLGNIVLGLSMTSGVGDILFELTDSNGKKDSVILRDVTTTEQFYRIVLGNLKEVDLTKIISLNLVILNANVTSTSGTLNIRIGDQPFMPVITTTTAAATGDTV